MIEKSPCTVCVERYHACHDTCAPYKEWKSKLDERRKARQTELRRSNTRTVKTGTRMRSLSHKK